MKSTHLCLAAALTTFACTMDVKELKERTVTSLGPEGGRALSAGKEMSLDFGQGALGAQLDITIETLRSPDVPRLRSQFAYELGPEGLAFQKPVTLTIQAAAQQGEELAVANIDGPYPEILESSVWNRETGEVSATLEHFSAYAVVAIYNPCAGLSCGDSCTICDPMNPGCTEPPPTPKACNRSGLCVEAAIVECAPAPDAGLIDMGAPPDLGDPDLGDPDMGVLDTGEPGDPDLGSPDMGEPDLGPPDTGIPSCMDSFQQNPQPIVDILIVMDDSCSMSEEQATLSSSFNLLLNTLTKNNVDFHIGVTSTDVSPTGAQGALIGSPAILESTTPNLAQAFAANVMLGINGSPVEEGLEASRLALSPGANPGFLRSRGSVAIIYVSDEEDYSQAPLSDYETFLLGLGGPRRIQANAIVGDLPTGCTGPGGSAQEGIRYDGIRQATGGAFSSICTPPWSQALTDLGGSGFGYLFEFELAQPVTGILSVTVDGTPVPELGPGMQPNWSYDPVNNTLIFSEFAVPGPDALIEVVSGC